MQRLRRVAKILLPCVIRIEQRRIRLCERTIRKRSVIIATVRTLFKPALSISYKLPEICKPTRIDVISMHPIHPDVMIILR